jgi:hypothetical protein
VQLSSRVHAFVRVVRAGQEGGKHAYTYSVRDAKLHTLGRSTKVIRRYVKIEGFGEEFFLTKCWSNVIKHKTGHAKKYVYSCMCSAAAVVKWLGMLTMNVSCICVSRSLSRIFILSKPNQPS